MTVHLQALVAISNRPVTGEEIDAVAREQLKELTSEIKKCTATRVDADLVYLLPENTINFPIQCLKEHSETKWEAFARAKGIKKKKGRMVFDEEFNEWIPRFGPYSKKNLILNSGVHEEGSSFSGLKRARKKNVEKNKAQQEANRKKRLGL
jgi:regulator of ribosome biosynthesis